MIRVFVGYDPRESVAFEVLAHSLNRLSSVPLAITPLRLDQLGGLLSRPRDPKQSTDFAFSRFLVPHMSDYTGWSIFMDCDMLALDDLAKLWSLRDEEHAVMVVKHDYVPKESTKFLGEAQHAYGKKNWSSMMFFNNERCRHLTPELVNTAPGLDLHQFKWLEDREVGSVPACWNHLVGVSDPSTQPSLVHYTLGGPYFSETRDCDYSDEWREEYRLMTSLPVELTGSRRVAEMAGFPTAGPEDK